MSDTEEHKGSSQLRDEESHSTDYVRFIILSGARTGSNMLAQALDSAGNITCFREVFNFLHDFVPFEVEGYDNFSAKDLAWRSRDPVGFLEHRIYCAHPPQVRAVGFKFHYGQFWGYQGLLDRLIEDEGIRVLHLKRRNVLRMLVSLRLARQTGVFIDDRSSRPAVARVARAARHPLRALQSRLRRVRRAKPSTVAGRPQVTVSPEELYEFIIRTNQSAGNFDEVFSRHPGLPVFYEDMIESREDVFAEAQSFLDVEPQSLTVTMRRQNPEPLSDLIANYEELREAFKGTPQEPFFD